LKNTKELVVKFKGILEAKVRQQEKLYVAEEKNFRRWELPEKYTAKMLYRWDNRKFKTKYLKKIGEKLKTIERVGQVREGRTNKSLQK